ncbi:glutamic acid-rich protein isoform X2 [Mycetomoellerius zeteki]|uniref:glutamic acid-rich protein isoform X2 n=1 Tax=Mycetomoellerius zeteki TaxID=64791 RepID=UPI00084E51EE|nr:PREDICTED: glutamic acid-rich protein-like isoform X2 [Trachymyrmex zeteki]
MIDDDKTRAMFMSALLSILLILSGIRTAGDGFDYWDFPRSPASDVIMKDIHGCALHIEPLFYGGFMQPPQRRLLEHPRKAKQVYRSHDYNVARGHRRQPRNKLDEGRLYRSSVKNDEDENEEEEEEEEEGNQNDEEDKLDDEDTDEETAEQDEEETVNEEPKEVYDYETEVRNIASQDVRYSERRAILPMKVFSASLLILLLA